jgi:predicted glycosyltransferase
MRAREMKVWVDVVSPSTVPFFKSLLTHLNINDFYVTAGISAETTYLLRILRLPSKVVWKYPDISGPRGYIDVLARLLLLGPNVPSFDVGLGFANFYVPLLAKSRLRPSVIFTDLDSFYAIHDRSITFKLANYVVCPSAISRGKCSKLGLKKGKTIQFDGYKEDVYISDYVPDREFANKLPIEDYVLVRPEATFAIYVPNTKSIVPTLLKQLLRKGLPVVYVPRTSTDFMLAKGMEVHILKAPLNGLDLCWHSRCVMTGSGSFAREAACLGVPAASFFPGELLSVDEALIRERKIFHSRNVDELVDFACSCKGNKHLDISRSKAVRNQLVKITMNILTKCVGTIDT